MIIAIGYARLSDKDSSANSIPAQIRRIEAYCQVNKLVLSRVFVDDGKSGWTFDRPGFIELDKYCREHKEVAILVIPHFDRFSRTDPIDAMTKERYFRDKLGVKVLQVSEPVELDTAEPMHQLIRFIQAFNANQERRRIVERTENGMHDRLSQGFYCGMAPIGYDNSRSPEGNKIITINEEAAYIVRAMFKEYIAGMPLEQVRKFGENLGYKRKGNSAVREMLSNPVYAGMVRVPAHKGKPTRIIKAKHPGIISENEYWHIQEMLTGKKAVPQNRDEVYLRGALKCHCGAVLTAGNSKGRQKYYWYYLCNEHRDNFSAIKLHGQFMEMLSFFSYKENQVAAISYTYKRKINEWLSTRGENCDAVEKQLKDVRRKIEITEEKYLLQPDISQETYNRVIISLRAEEGRLAERLSSLNTSQSLIWSQYDTLVSGVQDVAGRFEAFDLTTKHRFVNTVFDRSLSYHTGSYRTQYLHELFAHNQLILNEKRLLIIEKPVINIAFTPLSAPDRSSIEHLLSFAKFFEPKIATG